MNVDVALGAIEPTILDAGALIDTAVLVSMRDAWQRKQEEEAK